MAALIPDKRCFILAGFIFFLLMKTEQAISGTSAATYKVMEPHWKLLLMSPCLLNDPLFRHPSHRMNNGWYFFQKCVILPRSQSSIIFQLQKYFIEDNEDLEFLEFLSKTISVASKNPLQIVLVASNINSRLFCYSSWDPKSVGNLVKWFHLSLRPIII